MNNKKLTLSVLPVALCCTLLVSSAFASLGEYLVTAKHVSVIQVQQARSITQGMNLGKLTPREVAKLKAEQLAINKLEQVMVEDGVITSEELGVLFAKLEIARKHINHLARNSITTSAKAISKHEVINDGTEQDG